MSFDAPNLPRWQALRTAAWGVEHPFGARLNYETNTLLGIGTTYFDVIQPQNRLLNDLCILLDIPTEFAIHCRNSYSAVLDQALDVRSMLDDPDGYNYHAALQRGMVLTGQPGVGKSVFILYALLKQLSSKRPVILQVSSNWYILFTELGVYPVRAEHTTQSLESGVRPAGSIIALCNSDQDTGPPAWGLRKDPSVVVIMVTEPDPKRWREFQKTTYAQVYFLDVWTDTEFEDLGTAWNLPVEKIYSIIKRYGPSPRNLLRVLTTQEGEKDLQNEIKEGAALSASPKLTLALAGYDSGDYPSGTFWIRPKRLTTRKYDRVVLEWCIPTRYIATSIIDELAKSGADGLSTFMEIMGRAPLSRGMAKWLLEAQMHVVLRSETAFEITYHKIPKSYLPQVPPPNLQNSSKAVTYHDLVSIQRHIWKKNSLQQIKPFYWHPDAMNYHGIDGILYADRTIFVIQNSLFGKHPSMFVENLEWEGADGHGKGGWARIKPSIDGLRKLGALVVGIYVVDSEQRGQELCRKDKTKDCAFGYVDMSSYWTNPLGQYIYQLAFKEKDENLEYLDVPEYAPDTSVPHSWEAE